MSDKIDINELQEWINAHPSIPETPPRERTLMDIMGIDHRETSWSAIYAFFLNQEEAHGFEDLFIRSLEELCPKSEKKRRGTYKVEVEVPTVSDSKQQDTLTHELQDYKRIDILLTDEKNKRAIIIENKVRHVPVNPFNAYIKYAEDRGYTDIKTVILSLYEITEKDRKVYGNLPENFISITHKSYMERIKKNLPRYSNRNQFYDQILKEFMKNIENQTNLIPPEQLEFYYKNFSQIHKISELVANVEKEYNNALKEIKDDDLKEVSLERKLHSNGNDSYFYLRYKKNNNICLTVFLLPDTEIAKKEKETEEEKEKENNNRLRVILELQGKTTRQKIKETELAECKKCYTPEVKYEGLKKEYGHIAEWYLQADNLSPNNLQNLILQVIGSPIYELGKDVVKLLKESNN
ncbi:MAG: PD-(D/E)XK nuclease family protein [Paludibacteraceae bacterium]|nr:PD-(D/E)XK nuclease family protein [Paludibacteraceae bacterium]